MGLLDNIKNVLTNQGGDLNKIANLLAPAALGGLLGAFMTGKKGRKIVGQTLMVGGGAAVATILWKKYKDRLLPASASNNPEVSSTEVQLAAPGSDARAARLIKAMIFAAKSDGQVDGQEWAAIESQIAQLKIGAESEKLVKEALDQPLNPALLADPAMTPEESLELYLASCAVIELDHFMENVYLEKLAEALNLPADIRKDLDAELQKPF